MSVDGGFLISDVGLQWVYNEACMLVSYGACWVQMGFWWGKSVSDGTPMKHAWSETHQRSTCLIGDQLETDKSDRRPVGDRHASSETRQRPTCLIEDQHAWSEPNMPDRRRTCLIGDPLETNLLDRRSIRDPLETDMPDWRPQHASLETHKPTCPYVCIVFQYILISKKYKKIRIFKCVEIPIRLRRRVGLRWGMSVPLGHVRLRSGISVSDGACQSSMKHGMGLRLGALVKPCYDVSHRYNMFR